MRKRPKSRYIDDKKEGVRHWIGYRAKDIVVRRRNNENLLRYAIETLGETPRKLGIPDSIVSEYHLPGFFFKMYEEIWGRPPNCPAFGTRRLNQCLLYSESYTAIMTEIEKRGLAKVFDELKEQRKRDFKEGKGISVNFADYVPDPWIDERFEQLRKFKEAQKKNKGKGRQIIIGAAVAGF